MKKGKVYVVSTEWYEEHKGSSDAPTNGSDVNNVTMDKALADKRLEETPDIHKEQIKDDLENFGYEYDSANLHCKEERYCNGYRTVTTTYDDDNVCLSYTTSVTAHTLMEEENK